MSNIGLISPDHATFIIKRNWYHQNILKTSVKDELSDIDDDGRDEAFIVGDLFNVEVETVRYDASTGVILKWTEDGFVCMDNKETGFVGTGDARKVEIIEQPDGKKLIVLANNNGPLETFLK